MRVHRGASWHWRVELGHGIDVEADLTQLPLPRVKLWPDERGMLVGLSLGDRWSDPIVGMDLRLEGRFGRWWADRCWRRRHRRQEARRGG